MKIPSRRESRRWERAVREHRAALASFLRFLEETSDDAWLRPAGKGKWSPAEVTEHLALAYEALLREVGGGAAMGPRVKRSWQPWLRWFLLPHMLFHRTMPRARAPRETRPGQVPATREEGLARLKGLAERAERAFVDHPDARLTHPHFGPLDRIQTLRLAALHLEHHQRAAAAAAAVTRTS